MNDADDDAGNVVNDAVAIQKSLLPTLITEARSKFKREGAYDYFESRMGGSKAESAIGTLIGRVVKFLVFCHFRHRDGILVIGKLLNYFVRVIIERYAELDQYCTHLTIEVGWKISTARNTFEDIHQAAKWLMLFSRFAGKIYTHMIYTHNIYSHIYTRYSTTMLGVNDNRLKMNGWNSTVSPIKASLQKTIREGLKDIKTVEHQISEKRYPPGNTPYIIYI